MSGGVRKLASVVVGAVVGFAQGGPWGAVAGAALAFYASEQQEKLNTKSPLRDNEPSAQTVRSSKAPVRFILGRVSTGGVLVWAQEQAGAQGEGEWLHLVYVLCEGPITALENIYLGEEEIGSYGAQATYELVVNPTQVNAFLKANCPDWKDSQIGRGLSFVRVSLQYSAEKFPSGIPDTRFVVRGRNDVYDPRTGTAVYSANTALHLLWFLRARCGVPDDEIVFETFASAANVCDEALTNADGSTSQRYRSGCVIGADEQRTGVLQKLEAACGGHLIRVGGRWMLQAGAYYGPYDFEITEDMVIGTVTGSTEPTNDSAINTVRGTFIDPSQSWTETDYPEVSVAEWIVEDGGEAAETLTYSYVTDPYQAQRLANMELRRRRAGGAISIPMNFAGYNCRPGRVVRVNLPSLNILGEFIVSDWSMGDSEGCTVQVKQYEAAIFDDAVGQPYNPIGFINLPAGGLGTPSAVTWTQDTTAEVTQGVLSWLPPTGIVKEYIVIIRQGASAVQSHNVPATSTEIAINGLPSGNYTMSVAAVGPMARSGEATITVSINGPPIPESCVVQSSIDSIVLIPSNSQNGLNGGTYEYFFSTSPTATAADAEYLGQGLTFTHNGLGFWTNYYYFIRSSNAYGKSAFLYVPAQTSNDVSAYLAALAGKITETELGEHLLEEINKIPGLQEQIDALDGLEGYDPEATYVEYDLVVQGKRIYQATGPVPLNAPPPNPLYWLDVGQTVESANGLAQQVQQNTASITDLSAETKSLQVLRAAYRDDGGEGDLQGALKLWDTQAAYSREVVVRATQDQAQVTATETLQATVGDNTAIVQQVSQAQANTDGKLSTMWSVKMQVTANGQYVAAGIGLGIENTGAGLQSQFLVAADRFAIVNTIAGGAISVPFAVQGGQVFMNSAFIQDGSITMLKIGQYLQSDNYVAGALGWRLDKAGNLEFNGPAPGGGRLTMTNRAIKVFDQNGVKRVQLGDLDA
ncbi:DUF1983 domain-containing protein [Pseudomonas sp. MIS38]|uniref:phage tail tip fiber protein n=1 Tax=Pseudomonas sp. MIS38 TaxID=91465 RepID=UPI001CA74A8D|nr:DUF1983 domain-containing protein [Pseudomonas sp. MIS38]MBY8958383.1 DUF1983 domain-containing protein [Pseudomonas sp. MIS38]